MPTKAQNEVFKSHGVRKGDLYRRMKDRQMLLSGSMQDAFREPVSQEEMDYMTDLVWDQAADSQVWRAYQECDRE